MRRKRPAWGGERPRHRDAGGVVHRALGEVVAVEMRALHDGLGGLPREDPPSTTSSVAEAARHPA
ncbi:hypothetical protein [Methylobacterium sp. P1-11]|uniref:hypothetical protein n=1 Tax=Methylobacterium sp. P1-11 TaxID=2024616 RepID=UPI0015638B08|nr:hypothetical protein [Methylobacterium sp. P1-11]